MIGDKFMSKNLFAKIGVILSKQWDLKMYST